MRILNCLMDPRLGGPQVRALDVAIRLREMGVQTLFLLPNGTDEFALLAGEKGFKVCRPGFRRLHPVRKVIKNSKYLLEFYQGKKRIERLIRRENIDIVHASMTLNFQPALATRSTNVPLAWFFNDTGTPWPLNRLAGRAAQHLADDISVAADAVHDYFFDTSVNSRTIYPPVDTNKFNPNKVNTTIDIPTKISDPKTDTLTIGTVGNINPIKGHKYLIQALSRVDVAFSDIEVLIAGAILESRQEYYNDLLQLRAGLDLEGEVHFIGHTSDVSRFLNSLDLFVFPSVKEACPIAVLEAMAMELPIVATEVGGIPEEILDGKHGWLVPPKDPESLSEALCNVLRNPKEGKRRGKAARKRAKQKFSLQRCAEQHKEMYDNII